MDIEVILIVAALAVGGYFLWTRVIAPRIHRATPTPTPTTTRDYPQPKRYHDDDIADV